MIAMMVETEIPRPLLAVSINLCTGSDPAAGQASPSRQTMTAKTPTVWSRLTTTGIAIPEIRVPQKPHSTVRGASLASAISSPVGIPPPLIRPPAVQPQPHLRPLAQPALDLLIHRRHDRHRVGLAVAGPHDLDRRRHDHAEGGAAHAPGARRHDGAGE